MGDGENNIPTLDTQQQGQEEMECEDLPIGKLGKLSVSWAYWLSIQETEAGGWWQVQGQTGIHGESEVSLRYMVISGTT